MPPALNLFTIGFGRPDLLREQKRLLDKYMQDVYGMMLIDNSSDDDTAAEMDRTCEEVGVYYLRCPSETSDHAEALNFAAEKVRQFGCEYFMFLDHDVFPRRPASVIPTLQEVGFYGVGQYHSPTGSNYLWPGLCGFSRSWLNGRRLDFTGIRGVHRRDDGDTGSGLGPLFAGEDWHNLHGMEHGYQAIRAVDGVGLQSWGVEILGDFVHLSNASDWMEIPDPEERRRLTTELVAAL